MRSFTCTILFIISAHDIRQCGSAAATCRVRGTDIVDWYGLMVKSWTSGVSNDWWVDALSARNLSYRFTQADDVPLVWVGGVVIVLEIAGWRGTNAIPGRRSSCRVNTVPPVRVQCRVNTVPPVRVQCVVGVRMTRWRTPDANSGDRSSYCRVVRDNPFVRI